MLPFYIYYSMFGFQRVGDLIWAAADQRARGFLIGATAGPHHARRRRPAAPGRHQPPRRRDRAELPRLRPGVRRRARGHRRPRHARDARGAARRVLLRHGDERELPRSRRCRPEAHEGVLRGMYRFRARRAGRARRVQLLGSGAILGEAHRRRRTVLAAEHGVAADVWSVTSFSELARDGRRGRDGVAPRRGRRDRRSYVTRQLAPDARPDRHRHRLRARRAGADPRVPAAQVGAASTLGTDGFGRSDTRAALRRHFEVDAGAIVEAALRLLD